MGTTLMERIQEELEPEAIGNALYELMLDWYQTEMDIRHARTKAAKNKAKLKQTWTLKVIGKFLQLDEDQLRKLLHRHFNLEQRRQINANRR